MGTMRSTSFAPASAPKGEKREANFAASHPSRVPLRRASPDPRGPAGAHPANMRSSPVRVPRGHPRGRTRGPGSQRTADRLLATPLPHLHPAVPGRLKVREHEYSAALVYSHLTQLGWVQSLPKDSILAGAARCLTGRVARYRQRRLPLEFCLATNLQHLPLGGEAGDAAIVVSVPDTQLIELQQPIQRLEKKHPQAGRFVWSALHRGLGSWGSTVRLSACFIFCRCITGRAKRMRSKL